VATADLAFEGVVSIRSMISKRYEVHTHVLCL
jgi:hypothetical protein